MVALGTRRNVGALTESSGKIQQEEGQEGARIMETMEARMGIISNKENGGRQ